MCKKKTLRRILSVTTILGVCLYFISVAPLVSEGKGKPPPPQSPQTATLTKSLELRQIDSTNVPFQHNRPYSTFERQNDRAYLDLAGTWKHYKLNSRNSDNEINTTLSRRDGSIISSLEDPGYHTVDFNDSNWDDKTLPVCENEIGISNEERVYWFRRHFTAPSGMDGKYVKLALLGANYVTDVWVNGKYISWHEGGYTSFTFDITSSLNYGQDNVIAVRVHNIPWDNRNQLKDIVPYKTVDFRNYGGVFRDIYLEAANPLHIVRTDIRPSLKLLSGDPIQDEGHIDVDVVVYNAGNTTQTADISLSVYGSIVNAGNILDPKPEAIINASDPITITGTSSNYVQVPVTTNIYQDLEPSNGTPGNYFEDLYQSNPAFESTIVHSGTRSLKITTGSGGGTVAILAADSSGYLDLSTATSISLWIYDTVGDNTLELRLKDAEGDGNGDGNTLWSTDASVQNQWTKITLDLSLYPDVPNLDLDRIAKIELYEWNQGTYYFDDLGYTINDTKVLTFSLDLSGTSLWDPTNPELFILKTELNYGQEAVYTQFGIREVEIDNTNCRFLLNKVPTFLAGIARHESMPSVYRKFTENEMSALKTDFQNAKDANINFIRTGHYANHPYAYILADRMGIMIWEELATTWFDAEAFDIQRLTRQITKQMWLEMIYRDYNRPSIIIWATNNEGTVGAESQKQAFNEDLYNTADAIDGTRLMAQAVVGSNDTDSSLAADDILGINEYWGVFYGTEGDYYGPTKASIKRTHDAYPTKPILVSEMGTWSYEDLTRMTEQVNCWNDTYQAFEEKPYIAGVVWWCLNDWYQAPGTAQTMGAITWDRTYTKDVYTSIANDYANTWTQPVVKIIAPSDDNTVNGNVNITAYAEDFRGTTIGISSVQYKIDDDTYTDMTSQGNNQYTATWNSTTVSNGAHTMTVKATDNNSHEKIHLIDVTVEVGNQPPVANFTYLPASPTTADTIQFTDTSTDADGTVVGWSWDFGDGSTSDLQNPTYQYPTANTYTVTLTVTDNGGAIDTTNQNITVNNGGSENLMHVQSIDMSTVKRGSRVNAIADVLVVDASEQAVEGALVYGQWSGLTSDSDQELTNGQGHAISDSNKLKNPTGTFTYTVTDITKDGWTYDSESNVETFDSITYP